MKNAFLLITILLVCFSCSSVPATDLNGELPKKEIESSNNAIPKNPNATSTNAESIETDVFFNELADKLPALYENLIPKLKRTGYTKILLKRYPQFGFRIEHNGMEWIVKSVMKRRKYLLDTIALMINLEFVKFFQHENIQLMFSDDVKDQSDVNNSEKNYEIADAMLIIEGNLDVRPLQPLSITGMEYVLRLKYEVQAYLIDLKTGSKTWFSDTKWRRNLMATTMD